MITVSHESTTKCQHLGGRDVLTCGCIHTGELTNWIYGKIRFSITESFSSPDGADISQQCHHSLSLIRISGWMDLKKCFREHEMLSCMDGPPCSQRCIITNKRSWQKIIKTLNINKGDTAVRMETIRHQIHADRAKGWLILLVLLILTKNINLKEEQGTLITIF